MIKLKSRINNTLIYKNMIYFQINNPIGLLCKRILPKRADMLLKIKWKITMKIKKIRWFKLKKKSWHVNKYTWMACRSLHKFIHLKEEVNMMLSHQINCMKKEKSNITKANKMIISKIKILIIIPIFNFFKCRMMKLKIKDKFQNMKAKNNLI